MHELRISMEIGEWAGGTKNQLGKYIYIYIYIYIFTLILMEQQVELLATRTTLHSVKKQNAPESVNHMRPENPI